MKILSHPSVTLFVNLIETQTSRFKNYFEFENLKSHLFKSAFDFGISVHRIFTSQYNYIMIPATTI